LVISSHENGVKVGAEAMKNEVIKYLDTIIEKKENKQQ
jgi:hypothetical protein